MEDYFDIHQQLFAGKSTFAGLSNEDYLAQICPIHFRDNWMKNVWCNAAEEIFFNGADVKTWKWQDEDQKIQQLIKFKALLGGFGLPHESKIAVAGWMLSEMLKEVPRELG